MSGTVDAQTLHDDLIVIDMHVDTVLRYVDLGHDLTGQAGDIGYMDFPKMKEGNFTAACYACCVEPEHVARGTGRKRVEQLVGGVCDYQQQYETHLGLARTGNDVRDIAASGRFAVIPAIEGAQGVGEDLASLESFARMGVRYMSPTHFNTNLWGDSSTDVEQHGGLSALGREAIAELNRLGIIIDVAHVSDKTFWDIIELSTQPVIASHSSVRALVNHPRNLSDEMICAIGEKGGVIGITPYPEYISPAYNEALERCAQTVRERWAREGRDRSGGGASTSAIATLLADVAASDEAKYNVLMTAGVEFPDLEPFLDHIEHTIALVGADRVGFGTDAGAIQFELRGLEDCTRLPNLTAALLGRGLSPDQVRAVMGGAMLDLLDRVPAGV